MASVMAVAQTVSGRHVQQLAAPRRSGCTWEHHANCKPFSAVCLIPPIHTSPSFSSLGDVSIRHRRRQAQAGGEEQRLAHRGGLGVDVCLLSERVKQRRRQQ